MKIKTILIDDDADSRSITRSFLEKYCPEIFVIAEAANVKEGVEVVIIQQPDLLLLDITMPDGTGFDLLKQISKKTFEVIFLTAHEVYAVEAFKYSAVGYLLKPIAIDDLREAIHRAVEKLQKNLFEAHWSALSHNMLQSDGYDRKLAIATSTGYAFIDVRDIIRCESHSNYTEFHLANGKKLMSSRNLGFYEDLLPIAKFCRIHHSSLVNIDTIEKYNKHLNGGTVILKDGTELDVSQRRKEAFFQRFLNR